MTIWSGLTPTTKLLGEEESFFDHDEVVFQLDDLAQLVAVFAVGRDSCTDAGVSALELCFP